MKPRSPQNELFPAGRIATAIGRQLSLLAPAGLESRKKVALVPVDMSDASQLARAELEDRYRNLLVSRLELRRLVTYVLNKNVPVYNWFKYKEGFSRQLVT